MWVLVGPKDVEALEPPICTWSSQGLCQMWCDTLGTRQNGEDEPGLAASKTCDLTSAYTFSLSLLFSTPGYGQGY